MILLRRSDTKAEALFLRIFESYHQSVFNYIYRIIGDRESAEDVVQDVFIKIYRNLSNYQDERKLSAWVFRIAHNTMNDYFRRKHVYQNVFRELDDMSIIESQTSNDHYSPEQYLLTMEMQDNFEKIIMNLPYKLKEVFLLRHEAELSFKEISKLLNCPVNRLLGRMHLAVKTIRTEMQRFMDED